MGLRIDMFTGVMKKVLTNGKKVVTQTAGGRTTTNVYDNNGKLLMARIKDIKRYDVGGKKVVTRTDVSKTPNDSAPDHFEYFKTVSDRVFNNEGKYLGQRSFFSCPIYPLKASPKAIYDRKTLKIGDIGSGTRMRDDGTRLDRYYYGNDEMLRYNTVDFDSKGLPIKHYAETFGLDSLI